MRHSGLVSEKDEAGKVECKFPEGTHRIKKQWAENRYSWLGEDGRSEQPEWQRCGKTVDGPEDMEDATAHGEPGCKVQLESWAEDEDLKDGVEEAAILVEDDSGVEDVLEGVESAKFIEKVKTRRTRKILTSC